MYGDLHVTESEKERLSVEISETGEKQRIIIVRIDERLRFACAWVCFDAAEQSCTTFCTHNAVKIAFKRRNISIGREITHKFG